MAIDTPEAKVKTPEALPGETGAQYTKRVHAMRTAGAEMAPEAVPLSGVRVAQDPLGISTGRVDPEELATDEPVPAGEPESEEAVEAPAPEPEPEVAAEPEPAVETEAVAKKGKLPEGFPGRAVLEQNDITTWGQLRKAAAKEQLTEMNGIGPATAERIMAELE